MPPVLARPAAAALLLAATAFGGCGMQSSSDAERARSQLYGLTRLDLHRCAGLPTKSETIDGRVLDSYETVAPPPSLALSLPAIGPVLGGGGFNFGGGAANCRATFELLDGKVVSLHYAGATSYGFGSLAVCGALIEHCLTDMPPPAAKGQAPGQAPGHPPGG